MKSRSLLFLFSFSVVAIFIIGFNSCKKVASDELLSQELKAPFNAAGAKEWYYGVFKKTPEWKKYYNNINSKIASAGKTSSPSSVPKLPDWDHPSYRKSGNLEIVEFPLVKSYNNVSVPSAGLSARDQKRIAEASLTRIVFIKNGDKIDVREVDYIPDMESLRKMNFDLSSNTLNKLDKNFSGRLVIKKWDGAEVGRRLVVNGKIIKKGILKKSTEKSGSTLTFNSAGSRQECATYRICEYQRYCEPIYNGDNIQIGERCTEWESTGLCWDEEYCYEVPDEGDCVLYGICDPPPGDGCVGCDDTPVCDMTEDAGQQALDGMSLVDINNISFTYGAEELDQQGIMRQAKTPRWDCIRINMGTGYEPMWSANFAAVRYKYYPSNDPWKWEKFSYTNTTHTSGEFFPCTSVAMATTVSCFIAGDNLSAHVALSFNAKITLTCTTLSGAPLTKPINGNKNAEIFPTD